MEIRELRSLISYRRRMVSLSTQAKNRLHSVLHRNRILPPEGEAFTDDKLDWWPYVAARLELVRMETE